MSVRVADEAAKVFADPDGLRRRGDDCMRRCAICGPTRRCRWVDVPDYRPFWAITKHADIMAIERANTVFTNSPRPVLTTAEGDDAQARRSASAR